MFEWFNVASFNAAPGKGYTNPVSRNDIYGPAYLETDLRVDRAVHLPGRGIIMHMRADAFNVWNTPNLSLPLPNISTNTTQNHGQILQTLGHNGAAGTNGRRIQLNLVIQY